MKAVLTPVVLATILTITGFPAHATTITANDMAASETHAWRSADAHETWTRGTVVRVSAKRGKLTIEHGPIENLEMMAMTMPFTVADTSLLEGLVEGDAIEFVADKNGDELVVTDLRRPAG